MIYRALIKISENEAIEMIYTNFRKSKAIQLVRPKSRRLLGEEEGVDFLGAEGKGVAQGEDSEIVWLGYVNYGFTAVVLYENKKMALLKGKSGIVREYNQEGYKLLDYEFDSLPKLVEECDLAKRFAVLVTNKVKFFDSENYKFLGEYSLPDGATVIKIENPLDTRVLMMYTRQEIMILHLETMKLISNVKMPESKKIGYHWSFHIKGTNIFIAEESNPDSLKLRLTAYEFVQIDPRFCDKTCHAGKFEEGVKYGEDNRPCKANFTPCSKLVKFFNIVIWVTLSVILLTILNCVVMIVIRGARDENEYREAEKGVKEDRLGEAEPKDTIEIELSNEVL